MKSTSWIATSKLAKKAVCKLIEKFSCKAGKDR